MALDQTVPGRSQATISRSGLLQAPTQKIVDYTTNTHLSVTAVYRISNHSLQVDFKAEAAKDLSTHPNQPEFRIASIKDLPPYFPKAQSGEALLFFIPSGDRGFEPKISDLGFGYYFIEDLMQIEQYFEPNSAEMDIFLARVRLGKPFITTEPCPERMAGFDSTVHEKIKNKGQPDETVNRLILVYNSSQASPELMIRVQRDLPTPKPFLNLGSVSQRPV